MTSTNVLSEPSIAQNQLSQKHSKMLFEESGISPDVVSERGYRTVSRSEVPSVFKNYQRRTGLLIPTLSPSGQRGVRLRPDRGRTSKAGKVLKYEQPTGVGNALDVHPRNLHKLKDSSTPLYITEGERKSDSLTSRGLCALTLTGVWGWVTKGSVPVDCWEHVALEGRDVYVVFDSDVMEKPEVQLALERLVAFLEGRGAHVLVVYLPGPEKGVDDYLVAGGTVEDLMLLARPFERQDLARERLSRDERLRADIAELWRHWKDMPVKSMGHNTRRSVVRVLVEEAQKSGKPVEGGLRVTLSNRTIAFRAAASARSVSKAIKQLEDDGELRRDNRDRKREQAASYVLFTRSELGKHYGKKDRVEGEGTRAEEEGEHDRNGEYDPGVYPTRGGVPELRWGTVLKRREVDKFGRTVDVWEYLARLGKKRGAIVEHLLAAGGSATVAELMERFAGEKTRPRDFKRDTLRALTDPVVIVVEGNHVSLTQSWREALEDAREVGGEQEAARLQAERYQHQRLAFRSRHKLPPPEPVPDAPPLDDMRQGWQHHPTHCACRACSERFGRVIGEHVEDCRCGVCFRQRREQSKSETRSRLVVIEGGQDEPVDEVDDWRTHSLSCECDDCIYPKPKYARPYRGATS